MKPTLLKTKNIYDLLGMNTDLRCQAPGAEVKKTFPSSNPEYQIKNLEEWNLWKNKLLDKIHTDLTPYYGIVDHVEKYKFEINSQKESTTNSKYIMKVLEMLNKYNDLLTYQCKLKEYATLGVLSYFRSTPCIIGFEGFKVDNSPFTFSGATGYTDLDYNIEQFNEFILSLKIGTLCGHGCIIYNCLTPRWNHIYRNNSIDESKDISYIPQFKKDFRVWIDGWGIIPGLVYLMSNCTDGIRRDISDIIKRNHLSGIGVPSFDTVFRTRLVDRTLYISTQRDTEIDTIKKINQNLERLKTATEICDTLQWKMGAIFNRWIKMAQTERGSN